MGIDVSEQPVFPSLGEVCCIEIRFCCGNPLKMEQL